MIFSKKLIFYGEELLAQSQTRKPEDHPLSAAQLAASQEGLCSMN
jgi:hypothetical protein